MPTTEASLHEEAVNRVRERVRERAARCILKTRDPDPIVAGMATAYLNVIRNLGEYVVAALRCRAYVDALERGVVTMEDTLVRPPVRWEFEHAHVLGDIGAAISCANRYDACSKFVGITPLYKGDPWDDRHIMLVHKDTSPWFLRLQRRRVLKAQLGSKLRSLVSHARGWTKTRWLEEFNTPAIPKEELKTITFPNGWKGYTKKPGDTRKMRCIPEVTAEELRRRTGYTPEDFWRECKKPGTVKPLFPQMEMEFS